MKLLIDENLSPRVAALLRQSGIDARHVLDLGLGGAPDTEVSAFAVAEGRVVVSADSDFATMLALSRGTTPSLVLLRSADQLRPNDQAKLLRANLPSLQDELMQGAVVSIGAKHIRVRRLPLR